MEKVQRTVSNSRIRLAEAPCGYMPVLQVLVFQASPNYARYDALSQKYFQPVPSISFGTFPIMKSFDLNILTIMLGILYPNTTPTPCVDPIGTNCISLVIFL